LLFRCTGQILEGKHLVRDIYAFKKGFPYPQLKLQVYNELDAYVKRQEQVSRSMDNDNSHMQLYLPFVGNFARHVNVPSRTHSFKHDLLAILL
jgi:hypothetical protein